MAKLRTLKGLLPPLADFGDQPAVVSFTETGLEVLSYAELETQVMALAGGLMAHGIGKGDAAAIFSGNRPEWVVTALALMAVGATIVPFDDLLDEEELRHALDAAHCRLIFTLPRHETAIQSCVPNLDIFVLDDGGESGETVNPGWRTLFASAPEALASPAPDEIAALFFTSGTTGPAKGVPLSHANIRNSLDTVMAQKLLAPGDHVLLPLPLHHSYPFIVGMLATLWNGGAMVLPAGLSGPEIVRALGEGKVKALVGVPRLYEMLYAGIAARAAAKGRFFAAAFRFALAFSTGLRRHFGIRLGRVMFAKLHAAVAPNLRVLACGGAWLSPELGWRLEGLGWDVLNGYGLVETSSISTFNPADRGRMESVGLPVPGLELRIDHPDAEGHGEVLIRGNSVFAGYHDDPDANREAFTDDGWFRTGDLGFLDEDGYLYIAGRVKEMIVLAGGKNVSPEEVEAVYVSSPYIHEVAVLDRGGTLAALVVPEMERLRKQGGGRIEDMIRVSIAELSLRLTPYKRVSGFAIAREPLPRTHLGKYRRHLLAEIYDHAQQGEGPAPVTLSAEDQDLLASPRARKVWQWLEDRFPDRRLAMDTSPQLDLGIDSLTWVELSMELDDRLGIRLSEDAVARSLTLRDLLQEIETTAETAMAPAMAAVREAPGMAEGEKYFAPTGPGLRVLGWMIYALGWILARMFFHLRVQGLDHVPKTGPMIIVTNHVSDLDPFVIGAALTYGHLRRTYWGADRDRAYKTAWRRKLGRAAHLFPVDDRAPAASMALANEVLADGNILVWFPEQWRSPTGELQRFLPGIGMLVMSSGANVVPAYIRGTFTAMPRGHRLPRLRPVQITFGCAIANEDLVTHGADNGDYARIADALHDAVARLGGEKPSSISL